MSDHIVVHQRDLRVECTHCGRIARVQLPVEIDVWLAAMTAFEAHHVDCPKPDEMFAQPCEDTLESGISRKGE